MSHKSYPDTPKGNISILMRDLPEGYLVAARTTKAMKSEGGKIKFACDLMWVMLSHLVHDNSLLDTAATTSAVGIAQISDVAVMKRLQGCNAWFKWNLDRLAPTLVASYLKPAGFEDYRVLALDASNVVSGGKTKHTFRLHYAIDLFTMTSHEWKVTDNRTGESLVNFKAEPGDLFLADRGYGSRRGLSHLSANDAAFVVRLRHNAFPMYSPDGGAFSLLDAVRTIPKGETADIPVLVDLDGGLGRRRLRVVAARVPDTKLGDVRKRLDRQESDKCEKLSKEAREMNEYVVLVTSLPDSVPAEDIMALYRYRWQVEIHFKRLKSLLGFGDAPKKVPKSMEAWLNGKLLLALLIEIQLSKVDFSPPGEGREEQEYLEGGAISLPGSEVERDFAY